MAELRGLCDKLMECMPPFKGVERLCGEVYIYIYYVFCRIDRLLCSTPSIIPVPATGTTQEAADEVRSARERGNEKTIRKRS